MTLFAQCTSLTADMAKDIADTAGASGDTDMVARAGKALSRAFRHFNNYADWMWMVTEAPTILVTAPFSPLAPGGGAAIAGSATGGTGNSIAFAVGNLTGLGVIYDDFVQGAIFASNSAGRVTATATAGAAPNMTATVGFANNFNASLWSTAGATCFITANRDRYDLPALFKQPYSVRLVEAMYTVRYISRRFYDRNISSEFLPAGTSLYYDLFSFGEKGKITMLRPPAQTDRLLVKYYRKMDPTSATADIPEQFEPYLTSFAKWAFLIDKADAADRAQSHLAFAKEGLEQMKKENSEVPDEDLMFIPGHYSYTTPVSPNSTRQINWYES